MDLFAKMTPSPAAGSPPPLFGAMKQRPPTLKKGKGELLAELDKYLARHAEPEHVREAEALHGGAAHPLAHGDGDQGRARS